MRFINLDQLCLPCGWEEKADVAKAAAEAAGNDDERRAVISSHGAVWAALKPALEQLSNRKCWYCEAIQERSDKHVDHFRPKNRVDEDGCSDHPGYWWLAFDWRNFRYSCTYCNAPRRDVEQGTTKGKGARFPLLDETKRC